MGKGETTNVTAANAKVLNDTALEAADYEMGSFVYQINKDVNRKALTFIGKQDDTTPAADTLNLVANAAIANSTPYIVVSKDIQLYNPATCKIVDVKAFTRKASVSGVTIATMDSLSATAESKFNITRLTTKSRPLTATRFIDMATQGNTATNQITLQKVQEPTINVNRVGLDLTTVGEVDWTFVTADARLGITSYTIDNSCTINKPLANIDYIINADVTIDAVNLANIVSPQSIEVKAGKKLTVNLWKTGINADLSVIKGPGALDVVINGDLSAVKNLGFDGSDTNNTFDGKLFTPASNRRILVGEFKNTSGETKQTVQHGHTALLNFATAL